MPPPDGWRPRARLYSPARNNTRSPRLKPTPENQAELARRQFLDLRDPTDEGRPPLDAGALARLDRSLIAQPESLSEKAIIRAFGRHQWRAAAGAPSIPGFHPGNR